MLGLHAISEAAISALPDRLTGRVSASAVIAGTMDVVTTSASRAIVTADLGAVFAIEVYAAPLAA